MLFQFHLTEKTTLAIMRDPELPAEPGFSDIRAALARLDALPEPMAEGTSITPPPNSLHGGILARAKEILSCRERTAPALSTRELAILIDAGDPYLAIKALSAAAPAMIREGFARKGGDTFKRYGKTMQANHWIGQQD